MVRRSLGILGPLLLALSLGLGAVATRGRGASFQFPLWKDVPGRTFAVLAHGTREGSEWAAFASRASTSARSRERPCVTVARITSGRYANAGGCGPLAPEMGLRYPTIHPLIGETGATVFAVSLSSEVRQVEIEFGSGRVIRQTPRRLSSHQAKKAHLPQFRFVAMALGEDACISRVTGFAVDGKRVLDSETHEC